MALASIFFGEEAFNQLREVLRSGDYTKVGLLVDSNTFECCYPNFMEVLAMEVPQLELIEIEPGEESKSLEILASLWESLGELQFDRNSLIINLGGGVVSDLGGFMAATYMRGIDFINFPTTLLAMADAAVGSKTGINFGAYKNRIGSFSDPLMVGIIPDFLKSLTEQELYSGWAEMLKHGLISDLQHWNALYQFDLEEKIPSKRLLQESIAIKAKIVEADKKEGGLRKVLNFGHSVGHALESYYASIQSPISHGHAVALGMQVELFISAQKFPWDQVVYDSVQEYLRQHYTWPELPVDQEAFLRLLAGDKKNQASKIRLVLLRGIGSPEIDQEIAPALVWDALTKVVDG